MTRSIAYVLLANACVPPLESAPPWVDPVLTTPFIESVALSCDVDASKWTLDAQASSWTGGGTSYWTLDGLYVETHAVPSIKATADGSGDTLSLSLKIASDWREVKPNISTAFACSQDPSVVFQLHDLHGAWVDCRGLGPDAEIWNDVQGIDACHVATR